MTKIGPNGVCQIHKLKFLDCSNLPNFERINGGRPEEICTRNLKKNIMVPVIIVSAKFSGPLSQCDVLFRTLEHSSLVLFEAGLVR